MALDVSIAGSIDKQIYERELSPWLPPRIFDCHVHVSLKENCGWMSPERRSKIWAMDVGGFQSWEQLKANHRALFPDRPVDVLAFGGVYREQDAALENEVVLAGIHDPDNHAQGLMVTRPEWSTAAIEAGLRQGFIGIKPYPDLAPQGTGEVSIYDFLPKAHLEVLDRHNGVLMLHIPRAGRLADPDNIRELLEIAERYPSVRMIIAHVGRAYALPTAEKGLPHFAEVPGIMFETSANLNADVFELALETVGPDRILFGTDLPVTMMRGVREYDGDTYINFTDGPYLWNTNRKSPEEEARYTSYVYQELRALIEATRRAGYGMDVFHRMMYSNAAKLLGRPLGIAAA